MLRISRAQLEHFSSEQGNAFVARVIPHLRGHFPQELTRHRLQEQMPLEAFVRGKLDEAESFGIIHEQDVRLYLECTLILHPGFAHDPAFPWAAEILGHKELSGTEKMNLMHDWVLFGLRGHNP